MSEELGGTDEGLKSVLRVRTQRGIMDPTIPYPFSHGPGGDTELGKEERYWSQNPGIKIARRQASTEGDPMYASSDVDVSNDLSVVIHCHGGVIEGTNVTIPDNVKLYSPLKCTGESLMFSGPEAVYTPGTIGSSFSKKIMLRSSCPGDPAFNKKYVLTQFDVIPEMIFNVDEGQLNYPLSSRPGIYECKGRSRLAYGEDAPTFEFELGKNYFLSDIIRDLTYFYGLQGRQYVNLNIIMMTCMANMSYSSWFAMRTSILGQGLHHEGRSRGLVRIGDRGNPVRLNVPGSI